jgi:hypothetical protein
VGIAADVIIPDGVVEIGQRAFADTRVVKVIMPQSVDTIDRFAFTGCKSLETVKADKLKKIEDATLGNSPVFT